MNLDYTLLVPAATSVLAATATLLLRRRHTPAQLLLCMLLLMEGFALSLMAVSLRGNAGQLFVYEYLFCFASALCLPLYYTAICSLTEASGVTRRQRQCFVLPLIYIVALTATAFIVGPRRYDAYCHALRAGTASLLPGDAAWNALYIIERITTPLLLLGMGIGIVIAATHKVRLFERRYNDLYAQRAKLPAFSARQIVVLSWMFLPLAAGLALTVNLPASERALPVAVCAAVFTIMQLLLGHFCYRATTDARRLSAIVSHTNTSA